MAQRRMLNKSISVSMQVRKLGIEAALLFTWMIPHADDDGRLKGNPEEIGALVAPMFTWPPKVIESYLEKMEASGLISRWKVDAQKVIELTGWLRHQQIRKDRYQPSKLPSKDGAYNGLPGDNQTVTNGSQMTAQYSLEKSSEDEKSVNAEKEK